MPKKVLILSSTPRAGGNSELLCEEFARGAREAGHEVKLVRLREYNVGFCRGCGACSERGLECPQKDDMFKIREIMERADVLVLATPVYFYTLSAQMKVLIDRTCSFYTRLTDKEFYFILTAADGDLSMMERTVECFRGFTDCLDGAIERGVIYGVNAWKKGEIKETPAFAEAFKAGANV